MLKLKKFNSLICLKKSLITTSVPINGLVCVEIPVCSLSSDLSFLSVLFSLRQNKILDTILLFDLFSASSL